MPNTISHDMGLLRFTTAGSVDDGKSTLIGRLLYDCKAVFEDQLSALERASLLKGREHVDLSLLTDGLKAEREQGITIDVAYRYFATPRRKFIIADTPGHVQYTRNMVTGASTANLALLLVDARHGVQEQTRRHAFISSLLGIRSFVLCVNKMDLVDYSLERFEEVCAEFREFASRLEIANISFVPISALNGDNVVNRSANMPWYEGSTLLYILENTFVGGDRNMIDARLPVQTVIRPQEERWHDFRGYAGQIAGGVFRPGDEIVALPCGLKSRIVDIYSGNKKLDAAFPPQSVVVTLADDIDISRGDMLAKSGNRPEVSQDIDLMLCVFSQDRPIRSGDKLILRHCGSDMQALVRELRYKVDVNTLHKVEGTNELGLNEIGRAVLRTAKPLLHDPYSRNRITGSVIIVDPFDNTTLAGGMILNRNKGAEEAAE
ncbi:MAG: 50S ribosome-binding GTPase [Opitutales bacterium]|nr:50S ribosome-binding GTPase [Opitutales bacterium]